MSARKTGSNWAEQSMSMRQQYHKRGHRYCNTNIITHPRLPMVLKSISSFRETLDPEEVYRRWIAIYIFFDHHDASLKPSLFLHNLIEHPVGISDTYTLPLYNSLALAARRTSRSLAHTA